LKSPNRFKTISQFVTLAPSRFPWLPTPKGEKQMARLCPRAAGQVVNQLILQEAREAGRPSIGR